MRRESIFFSAQSGFLVKRNPRAQCTSLGQLAALPPQRMQPHKAARDSRGILLCLTSRLPYPQPLASSHLATDGAFHMDGRAVPVTVPFFVAVDRECPPFRPSISVSYLIVWTSFLKGILPVVYTGVLVDVPKDVDLPRLLRCRYPRQPDRATINEPATRDLSLFDAEHFWMDPPAISSGC